MGTVRERRNGQPAIPDNLDNFLTTEQKVALSYLGKIGWQLKFVRRIFFEEPLVVLSRPNGRITSVLEKDGRINVSHSVPLRHR